MSRISGKQIDLRSIFSVKDVLQARGFEIENKGDGSDTIFPELAKLQWDDPKYKKFFQFFDNSLKRRELLKLIEKSGYEPSGEVKQEMKAIGELMLERNRFSSTFEWYIGELLIRKFGAFSAAYGVQLKSVLTNSTDTESGDYDVLAVLRNINLIYIECKSGTFTKDKLADVKILKCIERGISLHCDLSIIVSEKKINEIELKDILKKEKHPFFEGMTLYTREIKNLSGSKVYEWGNCFFLSTSKNLDSQLKTVLRFNEAKKSSMWNWISDCKDLGYICHELE